MSAEPSKGLGVYWILTAVLFVLRLVLGFATVPVPLAFGLSILATVVFLGLPIYALFRASEHAWTAKQAGLFLAVGALVHLGGAVLLSTVMPATGFGTVVVQSFVQVGIAVWTLGLGALVALMIKDKNLILPIALFLAGLDVFLVFCPVAPTARFVKQNPALFHSMAVSIPSARAATPVPKGAEIVNQAFVGPADLLFMAAFFVALSKFKMRVRETVKWLLPVMVGYLLVVMSPSLRLNMLPALVPIGITVLIVNRREFHMTKQERQMVWGAVVLSVGLAAAGLFTHYTERPRVEPIETSTSEDGQVPSGRGATPPPVSTGPRQ
jgi:hypothetical protein